MSWEKLSGYAFEKGKMELEIGTDFTEYGGPYFSGFGNFQLIRSENIPLRGVIVKECDISG